MTCDRALELLLEAEPGELALDCDTPLVAHVRDCAKCSSVAARLRVQADALVTVAAKRKRSAAAARVAPWRPVRWAPVATLVATAAVVVMILARPSDVAKPSDASTSTDVAKPADRLPSAPGARSANAAPGALRTPQAVDVSRLTRYVFEQVQAVSLESGPVAVAAGTQVARYSVPDPTGLRNATPSRVISVAPPAGVRATVMQTSDPAVTVVWLQPADSTRYRQ
ncbi:MAG TPA: hypothetical protein VG916_02850 [Gemmatimonadaceae bacterium]|nr:hypothetical protein [Gemmatimonadaceae bacterium]